MKTKKLIFIIFVCYIRLHSQDSNASVELYFGTEQASGGGITFTLSNQGQVWGGELLSSNCNIYYYKTNLFNNPQHIVIYHNQPITSWTGLDFTTSQDNGGVYLVYGYGLYKITTSESEAHFYIDYRDYRIGCSPYGNIGHPIEIYG
jgi:hypothetical protein